MPAVIPALANPDYCLLIRILLKFEFEKFYLSYINYKRVTYSILFDSKLRTFGDRICDLVTGLSAGQDAWLIELGSMPLMYFTQTIINP